MKVRALINTESSLPGWLYWRIIDPYEAIKLQKYDFDTLSAHIGQPIDKDVNILVLPRLIVNKDNRKVVTDWFDSIKASGTKLVYEADDDIWSEDYVAQITPIFVKDMNNVDAVLGTISVLEERRADALWTLQQCDAVTVSTESLAKYIRTLVQIPVYVVENAINVDRFCSGLEVRDETRLTIGWAGGRRNENDLKYMITGWSNIAREFPEVHFVLGGYLPNLITDNPIFEGRYTFHEWKDLDKYASSMQVSIGCCSVSNNPFALRKSPIKLWEYSLAGAAVVASYPLYNNTKIGTALLCKDEYEWFENIRGLLLFDGVRKDLVKLAQNRILAYHNLKYEFRKWVDAYSEMVV